MNDEVDRVAPTIRPEARAAGTQRWRSLSFLHWTYSVDEVRPLVPAALDLDARDGRVAVGLVPFAMEGVRPWWWPRRTGLAFLETNVRTYVVHRGRPGVFFFSLDASNRVAVAAARSGWGLPYVHAAMELREQDGVLEYASSRPDGRGSLSLTLRPGAALGPSPVFGLEFFLLERYLLFVERRGQIHEGQVHHTPYPVRAATVLSLDETLLAAAGLPPPGRPPDHVHFSPGVDVEVFGHRAVPPQHRMTSSPDC